MGRAAIQGAGFGIRDSYDGEEWDDVMGDPDYDPNRQRAGSDSTSKEGTSRGEEEVGGPIQGERGEEHGHWTITAGEAGVGAPPPTMHATGSTERGAAAGGFPYDRPDWGRGDTGRGRWKRLGKPKIIEHARSQGNRGTRRKANRKLGMEVEDTDDCGEKGPTAPTSTTQMKGKGDGVSMEAGWIDPGGDGLSEGVPDRPEHGSPQTNREMQAGGQGEHGGTGISGEGPGITFGEIDTDVLAGLLSLGIPGLPNEPRSLAEDGEGRAASEEGLGGESMWVSAEDWARMDWESTIFGQKVTPDSPNAYVYTGEEVERELCHENREDEVPDEEDIPTPDYSRGKEHQGVPSEAGLVDRGTIFEIGECSTNYMAEIPSPGLSEVLPNTQADMGVEINRREGPNAEDEERSGVNVEWANRAGEAGWRLTMEEFADCISWQRRVIAASMNPVLASGEPSMQGEEEEEGSEAAASPRVQWEEGHGQTPRDVFENSGNIHLPGLDIIQSLDLWAGTLENARQERHWDVTSGSYIILATLCRRFREVAEPIIRGWGEDVGAELDGEGIDLDRTVVPDGRGAHEEGPPPPEGNRQRQAPDQQGRGRGQGGERS